MRKSTIVFCLLLTFGWSAGVTAQVFINYRNLGTFSAPFVAEFGSVTSAVTGVQLSQLNGVGVVGGEFDALIEAGETLDVGFPFPAQNVRLASFPSTSNFVFEYEAFVAGDSQGTIQHNLISGGELNINSELGLRVIDSFTMTGIGGPTIGDNVGYVVFDAPPLVNASFEDGQPGKKVVPGWAIENNVSIFAGNAYTGENSVRLIVPIGVDLESAQLQQTFDGIVAGMQLQASAFALNSSVDPITGENFGRVILDFLDDQGDVIDVNPLPDQTGVLSNDIDASTPQDEFVFLNSGYAEAPDGSSAARITLMHTQSPNPDNRGTGSVFFDDAAIDVTSATIAGTFTAFGDDFFESAELAFNGEPAFIYEIIHDGVSQVRIDTFGSAINTAIGLYDGAGILIAINDNAAATQQSQLFFESLPAGRYLVLVGGLSTLFFSFFPDVGFTDSTTGIAVLNVSSEDPVLPPPPDVVGTFMPFGFDFFDEDIHDPAGATAFFYEILYDGQSRISITATDDAFPPTLAFYDEQGNIVATQFQSLNDLSVPAGTYYLGVGNFLTTFSPEFQFSSSPFPFGPVTVQVTTEELILGDVNCDGFVSLLDVPPFIDLIVAGEFSVKADINADKSVNLLDVSPFIDLLKGN